MAGRPKGIVETKPRKRKKPRLRTADNERKILAGRLAGLMGTRRPEAIYDTKDLAKIEGSDAVTDLEDRVATPWKKLYGDKNLHEFVLMIVSVYGTSIDALAKFIGVSPANLRYFMAKDKDLREAYQIGRDSYVIGTLEPILMQLAAGTLPPKTRHEVTKDSNGQTLSEKTIKESIIPDLNAIKLTLQNLNSERWSRSGDKVSLEVPGLEQLLASAQQRMLASRRDQPLEIGLGTTPALPQGEVIEAQIVEGSSPCVEGTAGSPPGDLEVDRSKTDLPIDPYPAMDNPIIIDCGASSEASCQSEAVAEAAIPSQVTGWRCNRVCQSQGRVWNVGEIQRSVLRPGKYWDNVGEAQVEVKQDLKREDWLVALDKESELEPR